MKDSTEPQQLWYKTAIFYAVIVEAFKDGNRDGIGDFVGLTEKLDYIYSLGVTCIWLLPFYPTKGRDNGYDVVDYYNVDPRLGRMEDFEHFVHEAKSRGLKVIIDLVVHHSSDEHEWFQRAKKGDDKYKDYYVWTEEVPSGQQAPSAFPGIEAGVWQFDPTAKKFFYHSFYHFEPDLNVANPDVQEEIDKIMTFWMEKGIDGFRMDAATLMFYKKGLDGTEVTEDKAAEMLEHWNNLVSSINPEAIILGEADVTIPEIPLYFGRGGRMQLLYNFLLNRYIFLALARQESQPITEFIKKLPVPPFTAQWVNFLRNHDELNIEKLTKKEQEEVFDAFAPEQGMRVYDRGIRRRLAPMLGGDTRRLKMAYSLLFALPGAVMLLYGDELGMGDDLHLPERMSVRIPMQWDSSLNAGFSESDPSTLVRSVVTEGDFRSEKVNVAGQGDDSGSMLNHIRNLAMVQKAHPHVGHGTYRMLTVTPTQVLGMAYDWEGRIMITLHNLSEEPVTVQLDEYKYASLEEFYSDGVYNKEELADNVSLHGYGYRWFYIKTTD